ISFLESTKEQETFERSKPQYIDRPTFFCDLYLTHFPVSTEKIIKRNSNNGICPRVQPTKSMRDKCKTIEGPVVYELVVYDKNGPKGCFIPSSHVDSFEKCVPFTEAEKLLNKKNNNDEDLEPAYAIAEIDDIEQNPVNHYRRNYLAGRLRLHQAGEKRDTYHQPEWYFWSNLRRNNTIQDILLAISTHLRCRRTFPS
uniref:Uncharacterized protein n=1 Tax=Romanomermis culicivorax TaxID=13658 RepID=A0A915J0G2_ROMCU